MKSIVCNLRTATGGGQWSPGSVGRALLQDGGPLLNGRGAGRFGSAVDTAVDSGGGTGGLGRGGRRASVYLLFSSGAARGVMFGRWR